MKCDVIQTDTVFVDATHIKAAANRKKAKKVLVAKKSARFYDEKLKEEINADRMAHGKTHLKDQDRHDKDDDDDQTPPGACTSQTKQQKQSETDPESGWFHKENIKKSLPIRSRLLAIKMDGSLITQCIRVMNMTVRLSQSFMKN